MRETHHRATTYRFSQTPYLPSDKILNNKTRYQKARHKTPNIRRGTGLRIFYVVFLFFFFLRVKKMWKYFILAWQEAPTCELNSTSDVFYANTWHQWRPDGRGNLERVEIWRTLAGVDNTNTATEIGMQLPHDPSIHFVFMLDQCRVFLTICTYTEIIDITEIIILILSC